MRGKERKTRRPKYDNTETAKVEIHEDLKYSLEENH